MVVSREKALATLETIDDPCLFAEHWLGESLWSKQREIMRSVERNPRTFVRACHSSSKTRTAAELALWWLAKYKESVVITTAPGEANLTAGIWAEIPTLIAKPKCKYPFPSPLTLKLEINKKRLAYGYTTHVQNQDQGVRFQGAHGKNVLIIVDEAMGVRMEIFDAIEGIMSGGNCRLLGLLNPTVASGYAYDCATRMRSVVHNIQISAFDTPNLAGLTLDDLEAMTPKELSQNERPYLATREWVLARWRQWGNDFRWQSRVLGEFPEQGEDALISVAWAEAARQVMEPHPSEPVQAGVDVAGAGEDETFVWVRQGGRLVDSLGTSQADPRGPVASLLGKYRERLELVNVDAIGIGYNFGLHLADLGFPVQLVNVGLPPLPIERDAKVLYLNLKAQSYWSLRQRFKDGEIANLTDDETVSQLTSIRWSQTAKGHIVIETKEEAKKRGVKSPDRAEALMLAFVPKVVQNRSGYAATPPAPMIAPI